MLHKDTRKALQDHNWIQLKERNSNPRLALIRLKNQSITAISDISLIAQKLPVKEQDKIFKYDSMKTLIEAILNVSSEEYSDIGNTGLDPRRIHLAAMLAEEGIKRCTRAYIAQNRDTPILTEATVDQLNRTIKVCKEIAYLVDLPSRKESENALEYVFNWSRVPGSDESKFVDFIENIFGSIYENFKDDNLLTHEIKKEDPVSHGASLEELADLYEATGKKEKEMRSRLRASKIVLNVIDMNNEIMATYSLILRFSSRSIKLIYEVHGKKGQLDPPPNIIVKQDYGNFYIYRRKSAR